MLTSLLLSSTGLNSVADFQTAEPVKLPRGKVMLQRLRGHQGQGYYLYIPHSCSPQAPLMISVHGISRNAIEHAHLLAPLAEQYGVVLVAPLFTQQHFPDYQRLGRFGRGSRADLALNQVIGDVLYKTACNSTSLYLFGYSGGGQFVHRYAMAHPERVAGVVVGAAGWYTFPDPAIRFPHGNAATASLNSLHFDPQRYLQIPISVIVGSEDNKRDSQLNKSAKIDKQQGLNRLQRGENWINTLRNEAQLRHFSTDYHLEVMPGIRHSFKQGILHGQLGERIFRRLFAKLKSQNKIPSAEIKFHPLSTQRQRPYTDINYPRHYANQMLSKAPC